MLNRRCTTSTSYIDSSFANTVSATPFGVTLSRAMQYCCEQEMKKRAEGYKNRQNFARNSESSEFCPSDISKSFHLTLFHDPMLEAFGRFEKTLHRFFGKIH